MLFYFCSAIYTFVLKNNEYRSKIPLRIFIKRQDHMFSVDESYVLEENKISEKENDFRIKFCFNCPEFVYKMNTRVTFFKFSCTTCINVPFESKSCKTNIEFLAKKVIPIQVNNKELVESEEYGSQLTGTDYYVLVVK